MNMNKFPLQLFFIISYVVVRIVESMPVHIHPHRQ